MNWDKLLGTTFIVRVVVTIWAAGRGASDFGCPSHCNIIGSVVEPRSDGFQGTNIIICYRKNSLIANIRKLIKDIRKILSVISRIPLKACPIENV